MFCSRPFAFFGRMGVGILVFPMENLGVEPMAQAAQKHC
jgi:hypothetical protein